VYRGKKIKKTPRIAQLHAYAKFASFVHTLKRREDRPKIRVSRMNTTLYFSYTSYLNTTILWLRSNKPACHGLHASLTGSNPKASLFNLFKKTSQLTSGRKTEHPNYVETPGTAGRRRGPRKSIIPSGEKAQDSSNASPEGLRRKPSAPRSGDSKQTNGSAIPNGTANGSAKRSRNETDPRVDYSGELEFGGDIGVTLMMILFPM